MSRRLYLQCILPSLAILLLALPTALPGAEPTTSANNDYLATTTADPEVALDELALLVKPLTADELQVEAQAWLDLLRKKTAQTSQAELAIKVKNKVIEKAEAVEDSLEDAQDALEDVAEASSEAAQRGDVTSVEAVRELAGKAHESVEQTAASIEDAVDTMQQVNTHEGVAEVLEQAASANANEIAATADRARDATEEVSLAADRALLAAESGQHGEAARMAGATEDAARDAREELLDTSAAVDRAAARQGDVRGLIDQTTIEKTARQAEAVAARQVEEKQDILLSVTGLRTQRTALTDRLNVVLDELSIKLGKTLEGAEHEFIIPFRLYAESVNGIDVEVTDTQSAWVSIIGWLRSDVGGMRLARNLGYFLLSVVSFWLLGWLLGILVDKALAMTRVTVELMRSVIVRTVRRLTLLIGVIIGLSAMGINIGPILALVGAAGFVVAFALQDTLSNFASGIMIMIYRPFDVGDMINVGGVTGEARSMNLVSTTIATPDNQILIVPNNAIWGNIITNITGSGTRRVDLVFRISYDDDIEQAQQIMQDVVSSHPLVLQQPEPTIALQELGPWSVDIICRPWTQTEDYWRVYRELIRTVKDRFQAAGMIPPHLRHGFQPKPPDDSLLLDQSKYAGS